MKFEVMSRTNARRFSFKPNIDNCIIISITDVGSQYNRFNHNPCIKNILHIKFDDVEDGEPNCITPKDATQIVEFVNHNIQNVDSIVVHCEAGISRSAGVCAALMQIINGDDMEIFNNPHFCPNMTCYRAVLTAYYGHYDAETANKKIQHNIAIWKEKNGII